MINKLRTYFRNRNTRDDYRIGQVVRAFPFGCTADEINAYTRIPTRRIHQSRDRLMDRGDLAYAHMLMRDGLPVYVWTGSDR